MVGEEAHHHVAQPLPLLWNRMMHPPPQFFLDFAQSGSYPITTRFPNKLETTLHRAPADMRKSKKIESLRLAKPALSTIKRRKAPELNQPGLYSLPVSRRTSVRFFPFRELTP